MDVGRCEPSTDRIATLGRPSGSVVASHVITDPYGSSWASFHRTQKNDIVALWVAAGQDGQQICWLNCQNKEIDCEIEPLLENTTPPIFSPTGDEFLVENDGAIFKLHFQMYIKSADRSRRLTKTMGLIVICAIWTSQTFWPKQEVTEYFS